MCAHPSELPRYTRDKRNMGYNSAVINSKKKIQPKTQTPDIKEGGWCPLCIFLSLPTKDNSPSDRRRHVGYGVNIRHAAVPIDAIGRNGNRRTLIVPAVC